MSANTTHSCMSAPLLTWHVVLNSVLAAIMVVLPIMTASWATRRFGGSSIGALLIAAMLMGVGAMWFLRELTMINGCLSGIEFPLGGGSYCGDS